jgi:hypothetical protein
MTTPNPPPRPDPTQRRELPPQPPTGTDWDFDTALEGSFGENRKLREEAEKRR